MQVSYWIIGRDNLAQAPAVAFDLHDNDGELVGETRGCFLWRANMMQDALAIASAFAQSHSATVHYDPDSTDFFRDC